MLARLCYYVGELLIQKNWMSWEMPIQHPEATISIKVRLLI